MKPYLISYDLIAPHKEYPPLLDALKKMGAAKVLLSEWLVRSDLSAKDIRDMLKKTIDANDKLLVVALTGEAAWTATMIPNDQMRKLLNG